MDIRHLLVFFPLALAAAAVAGAAEGLELQGHRGARGLAPENTLAAFAKALSLGVTTLELDVGVSADGVVVVAHDSHLNPAIVRGADGKWLSAKGPALSDLTLAELRRYDVGRIDPQSRYARQFPHQQAVDGAFIPTLDEVVALTRKAGNTAVRFNIETKLRPGNEGGAADAEAFADAVLAVIEAEGIAGRTTVQSFDWRTLRHVQRVAPAITTAYLSAQQKWLDNIEKARPGASSWTAGFDVDAFGGSLPRLVKAAGGRVWSPFHKEVDAAQLEEAHRLGLRVVVWTVNEAERMGALIDLGVDGIISDYPDRLRRVLAEKGRPLPAPTPVEP